MHKEQIPGVFRLPVAITAAILAVVITSFCIWCGVGSIAENVHGAGILMHKGRYVALTSPGEGLVVSFDVKVGDSVTNGQKVGVLYSKTDVERLFVANRRLERLKADYDRIAAECRAVADKKKSQHAQFLKHLDDFDRRIAGQVEWYNGHLDRLNQLKNSGAVSAINLREVEYRATIVSDASGRVSNVNVAPGDRVRIGDSRDETPESIQCDFRNNAFTQWIMSRTDGMPVKVRMLLETDPASASGFRWTGGGWPDIRIADGTVAERGTHDELMAKNGAYAQLVRTAN